VWWRLWDGRGRLGGERRSRGDRGRHPFGRNLTSPAPSGLRQTSRCECRGDERRAAPLPAWSRRSPPRLGGQDGQSPSRCPHCAATKGGGVKLEREPLVSRVRDAQLTRRPRRGLVRASECPRSWALAGAPPAARSRCSWPPIPAGVLAARLLVLQRSREAITGAAATRSWSGQAGTSAPIVARLGVRAGPRVGPRFARPRLEHGRRGGVFIGIARPTNSESTGNLGGIELRTTGVTDIDLRSPFRPRYRTGSQGVIRAATAGREQHLAAGAASGVGRAKRSSGRFAEGRTGRVVGLHADDCRRNVDTRVSLVSDDESGSFSGWGSACSSSGCSCFAGGAAAASTPARVRPPSRGREPRRFSPGLGLGLSTSQGARAGSSFVAELRLPFDRAPRHLGRGRRRVTRCQTVSWPPRHDGSAVGSPTLLIAMPLHVSVHPERRAASRHFTYLPVAGGRPYQALGRHPASSGSGLCNTARCPMGPAFEEQDASAAAAAPSSRDSARAWYRETTLVSPTR
jgi:hypothetical protein